MSAADATPIVYNSEFSVHNIGWDLNLIPWAEVGFAKSDEVWLMNSS